MTSPERILCALSHQEPDRAILGLFGGNLFEVPQFLYRMDNVRDLLRIWHPGGGFVFQQVHNILTDVPAGNIIAMLEAVRADERGENRGFRVWHR